MEWERVLAKLSMEGLDVVLQSFSKCHIDILIKSVLSEDPCFLTVLFGNPRMEERGDSWQLIKRLSHWRNLSWLWEEGTLTNYSLPTRRGE